MDIVKKNWLSITMGVIAILAVVGNFYPMNKYRDELHTQVEAHANSVGTLHDLLNKQRNLPVVVPGSTESVPLNGFPTPQAVEEAHKATDKVNKAADDVQARAIELNKHTPLFPGALPGAPGETLPQSSFARAYVECFPPPAQPGLIAVPPTTGPSDSELMTILHAGTPPTDAELAQARSDQQSNIEQSVIRRDSHGNVTNPDEVQQQEAAAFRNVGDQLRLDRAKQCKVYVDPAAFAMYPGMTRGAVPDPSSIFWAQIGLWTQEDICKAIVAANSATNPTTNAPYVNVMDAPIKELVKIGFVVAAAQGQGSSSGLVPVFVVPGLQPSSGVTAGAAAMAPPPPPPGGDAAAGPNMGDANGALPKNFQLSPTGRISNALYDTEQFELELIVDAACVPQVLSSIEAGQYITVTQLESVDPVDSALYRGQGYFFGDRPCVRIKMRCEELFLRDWLKDLVPAALKPILGYPPPQAAPPAA
jgi:hypothetical protein